MVSAIDPATGALVGAALNAGALRQAVHASNIALAGTSGHVPRRVRFEENLEAARQAAPSADGAALAASAGSAAEVVASGDAEVQLDQEVRAMSEDALHYQALVSLLNKQYALMGLALDGGKR
ncbi:flagellar basal body rod protein FlgB [Rhizobacter sp. P5_C2]|jgi:flagellar basal-body rod protein FlgB